MKMFRMNLQLFASDGENDAHVYEIRLREFIDRNDVATANSARTNAAVANGKAVDEKEIEASDVLMNHDVRMICMSLNLICEQLKRIADNMEKDNGGYDPHEPYDPSRCWFL